MPFTPTHILAVVPIASVFRKLPLSALAIGSMIPGLPMFIPFSPNNLITHSLLGVFTTCLPLGIATFLFFQYFIKIPVISLFPSWMQTRLMTRAKPIFTPTLLFALYVSVAIVIGAFTHILWDSFTHQGRWGTQIFPILNESVQIASRDIPGYKLFQYGSTIFGLPLFAVLCLLSLRKNAVALVTGLYPYQTSAKLLAASIVVAIPIVVAGYVLATSTSSAYGKLATFIITSGQLALALLVAYPLIFQFATRGKNRV